MGLIFPTNQMNNTDPNLQMTNQPKATQTLEEHFEELRKVVKHLGNTKPRILPSVVSQEQYKEVMEDVSFVEHVLAKDELKKLEVVRGRIKFYFKPTSHTYTITKKQ